MISLLFLAMQAGGRSLSPAAVSLCSALFLTLMILLGIGATLAASWFLSHTWLKGMPSAFTLELPPYRRPQFGKIIIRSIFDRTLFVLGRAVAVAAPAGLIIWLLANILYTGPGQGWFQLSPQIHLLPGVGTAAGVAGLAADVAGTAGSAAAGAAGAAAVGAAGSAAGAAVSQAPSLLTCVTGFLDPAARLIGLDGVILAAFLLGFPANEIVLPIILMAYLQSGYLMEMSDPTALFTLLSAHGWTGVTMICMMLFCLFHWPCSTSVLSVRKETGSWKWAAVSMLLPTLAGIGCCLAVTQGSRMVMWLCRLH